MLIVKYPCDPEGLVSQRLCSLLSSFFCLTPTNPKCFQSIEFHADNKLSTYKGPFSLPIKQDTRYQSLLTTGPKQTMGFREQRDRLIRKKMVRF